MQKSIKDGLKEFKTSYLKKNIEACFYADFSQKFQAYYAVIDKNRDKDEEFLKNETNAFLKSTFYNSYSINTLNKIDSAIVKDGRTLAIFEFKRPSNKSEMIQANNLNKKALHEAIFYYLGERINNSNFDLKKIIITDTINWFVFDAQDFEQVFFKDLSKKYKKFKDGKMPIVKNEEFFAQIIQPYFKDRENDLDFVCFKLDEVIKSETTLRHLYKLFHPDFLLKEYCPQDVNTLNKNFYDELLYIMGLKEETEKSKTLIVRNKDVQNTFLDAVYKTLVNEKDVPPEKAEDLALELVITWINRVLFIKLFESQLIAFNGDNKDFEILTYQKISDFDKLNNLFFNVLNKKIDNREPEFKEFDYIPYLNSSLFERTKDETDYCAIRNIRSHSLALKPRSSLTKWGKYKNHMPTLLEYLLDFLKSYSFSAQVEEGLTHENKEIINAAVLGLIFEKINGYKDGAVYTPSLITEYMAKEGIEKAVVQKFNEKYAQNCKTVDEVKFEIQTEFKSFERRKEISELINSLKICDPAVGSGHFLVSALNQLIAMKYKLGCIFKANSDNSSFSLLTEYDVIVEDDVLTLLDSNDKSFVYDKSNKQAQTIQQTIFNEKRVLIENCLFGVDINSKSVQICRLRLWIELLKNAYYKPDNTMETLPNIDINIKCGNSLISKIPFEVGKNKLSAVFDDTLPALIKDYKKAVKNYKETSDKHYKKSVDSTIRQIKETIAGKFSKQLSFASKEIANLMPAKKRSKPINEGFSDEIYKNSMEWAIEFPEILDDNGKFLGFDLVIGNPPYGVSIKGDYRKNIEKALGKVPDYEIYYYFIELAYKLLKNKASLSYIIPNTYLFNTFAEKYRVELLEKWAIKEILDCSNFEIFETATVRNTVNLFEKGQSKLIGYRKTKGVDDFKSLTANPHLEMPLDEILNMNQNWSLAFLLDNEVISLVSKIKKTSKDLSTYFPEISQGLIAYDKYQGQSEEIIKNRAYHYSVDCKEGLKKWLFGADVCKYSVKWNAQEYIDYCEGIANPRNPKFFQGKRLLVREITNPSIYAAITQEELYNDPSILIIKDCQNKIEIALGILNSKLATFYHFNNSPKAIKGAFPKILVKDLKEFPLPDLNAPLCIEINNNVNKILEITAQIDYAQNEEAQKQVQSMQNEIDTAVYTIYNLAPEEIAIIEGCSCELY